MFTANCIDRLGYKFTGKERDTETGLDYFGARYYGSNVGRWMSPDWSPNPVPVPYATLRDPQSLNLYGYVRNRPVASIDIDGHGEWYDKNGKHLGTDGVNNGSVVVVKDAKSVSYSSDRSLIDAAGSGAPMATFSQAEGTAMRDAVARSNAPNATDKTGGMHEEGFSTTRGEITNAPAGPTAKPGDAKATIVVPLANDTTLKVHVHPGGAGNAQFQQTPSKVDIGNVDTMNHPNMTNAVVGAQSGQVYIYNDKGVQAQIPLKDFPK